MTRAAVLEAASGAPPPCFWYYLLLVLGARLDDHSTVPQCAVETAVAKILLWYITQGRGNMISLKPAAVRHMIVTYAKTHRCYPYNAVQRDHEVEATLKRHMRILMAPVRTWARQAPGAMLRYLAVDRRWLAEFLAAHRPCA